MTPASLPLLIEPSALEPLLGSPGMLLVDLNRPDVYAQAHLPGAMRVEYADIAVSQPPAAGAAPGQERLKQILNAISLAPGSHVVAYDAESNTRAARFLWTLALAGHRHYSLLNGGMGAWQSEHRPLTQIDEARAPTQYPVSINPDAIADKRWCSII
jgi:thiosulfate/3-mercaptopyruvate sulfurtransferase